MRLTNMSFAMLYVGWLNYLMITVLPVMIVCAILLSPVFAATNAFVTAIFVAMYNVLTALFMFTIGTFFNRCESRYIIRILLYQLINGAIFEVNLFDSIIVLMKLICHILF